MVPWKQSRELGEIMLKLPMLCLFVLAVFCLGAAVPARAQTPCPAPLTFGVVPQQSATQLARAWGPIFAHIGAAAGCEVTFRTARDIPAFEQECADGEYDLAYMNPYHYTVFHEMAGYRAFARREGGGIRGIVVVRVDSPLRDVRELAGKSMAFPAPAAFAASVLPRFTFRRMGMEVNPVYVSSHDSVYLTVSKGLYPAGGGIVRTFSNMDDSVKQSLRVLWKTPEYTPHALAAHPRVPDDVLQRVARALYELDETRPELLEPLGVPGFRPAQDKDWDDVRALDIDLLDHMRPQGN
jgi:phosphonate transport system substrate-binding protein